ncbi:ubiquinol-cytochrome C reductase complex 14kD subunit-domain-containing protein [Lipomyces oligophaga]|uniref:ubiquinol-cytochrome C reductase complex 14kD subunit-domain-containing protein n=1 Tax=Lipomyces oligophaga TaxID=45792 RepID=UPI0034CE08A2
MTGSFLRTHTLANAFLSKAPSLAKLVVPLQSLLSEANGYRKLGLRYDDLIAEESEVVQKAISRLDPKEYYDRVFRIRRAMQLSLSHQLLPKEERLKPEDDIRYLTPYILEAEAELRERQYFDSALVSTKK